MIDEKLKIQISKTFERICGPIEDDLVSEPESSTFRFRLVEEVLDRSKEEFECNFEKWNNWIFEDDFKNYEDFLIAKKEIVNFVNKL